MGPEATELFVVIINALFGKRHPGFAVALFISLAACCMGSMILFADSIQDVVFPIIALGFLFLMVVIPIIRKIRNETLIDQQDDGS